jgi:hypothetical protein
MHPVVRQLRDFFVSLRLTVFLLSLSMILIFWGTLAQVQLGIWVVQQKFFHSFVVFQQIPGTGVAIPAFPGGYTIGGLLLINLIAAHIYRFKFEWRKFGIQLTHAGLIILLLGELFTGLTQRESYLRLDEGAAKNYSESHREYELALLDTTAPDYNDVVALPQDLLAATETVQTPKLPFQVKVLEYYPNAALRMRSQAPNVPANRATAGIGPQLALMPLPVTYKENEGNAPTVIVEFVGAEGSLGTWLASPLLSAPQSFTHQGRTWEIQLRARRYYEPHTIKLLDFTHEKYAGTEIPKNFASHVQVTTPDKSDERDVLIYMNNPLRYAGLTYYQAGFENNDRTTVLQVVRNPSWLLPYIACVMMGFGLLVQFGIHLVGFARKRTTA